MEWHTFEKDFDKNGSVLSEIFIFVNASTLGTDRNFVCISTDIILDMLQ